jgi:cytoskeletal protein RodZ
MDEEQAVADYLQAAGSDESEVQQIAYEADSVQPRYAEPDTTRRGFPFVPVLVLVVVIAAGLGGWRIYQQHMHDRQGSQAERQASQPSSAGEPAQVAPSNAGVDNSPSPPSSAGNPATSASTQPGTNQAAGNDAASPASSGFEVELKTRGRAWVSLKADGKILVRGVLDADQTRTLHAEKEIVVWTGNAAATQVSFESKPVAIEGGANEARVLVFSPNGLQSISQPSPRPAAQAPTQPTADPSRNPQ